MRDLRMTWLVTGANGQLGMAFRRGGGTRYARFATASPATLILPALRPVWNANPSVIINCAYTAVDAAEEDEATAMRINAVAVGEMARWATSARALMVHFSTDYVFDGAIGAYASMRR